MNTVPKATGVLCRYPLRRWMIIGSDHIGSSLPKLTKLPYNLEIEPVDADAAKYKDNTIDSIHPSSLHFAQLSLSPPIALSRGRGPAEFGMAIVGRSRPVQRGPGWHCRRAKEVEGGTAMVEEDETRAGREWSCFDR
ncbi:hypothetical protein NL676_000378 [Syzygium grande]|nr:hypothetical protein NL676_000378 [Syzygium grande]